MGGFYKLHIYLKFIVKVMRVNNKLDYFQVSSPNLNVFLNSGILVSLSIITHSIPVISAQYLQIICFQML